MCDKCMVVVALWDVPPSAYDSTSLMHCPVNVYPKRMTHATKNVKST